MKKKLLIIGLLLAALLWWKTGIDPMWLLIEFVAAGAVPGITVSLSPIMMILLALGAGVLVMWKLFLFEFSKSHDKLPHVSNKTIAGRPRRRFERLAAK